MYQLKPKRLCLVEVRILTPPKKLNVLVISLTVPSRSEPGEQGKKGEKNFSRARIYGIHESIYLGMTCEGGISVYPK
jgi:hypothetical protein